MALHWLDKILNSRSRHIGYMRMENSLKIGATYSYILKLDITIQPWLQ